MKITKVSVEIKQGLPNYSGRTACVEACADEGESLDIEATVQELGRGIKVAWLLADTEKIGLPTPPEKKVATQAPAQSATVKEVKKERGILDDD